MSERPIALFVPPTLLRRAAPELVPLPPLPAVLCDSRLLLGIAAVSRSGRVREQSLIAALGWKAGDRITTRITPEMIILRRRDDGPFHIDAREQFFLPAGARALFEISTGDRVALVAALDLDLLIVHPINAVAGLLADYYSSLPGGLRAD